MRSKKISGMLQQRLGPEFEVPEKKVVGDPAGHLERGKEHQKAGRYHEAGSEFSRALASPGVTAEQSAEASQLTVAMMRLQSSMKPFVERFLAHKWEEAVTLLERIPREDRANARGVLMEARCFQQLGRFANAQRAAARVLEAAASYGSWQRGEPRMMAVKLGADAAMEQGNSDKAIKFYKTVLKYDPDQKEIRKQYKKLKSVVKLLEQAEKHVTKGYNHKAVDTLDEILAELRGMDVDSNVFRSTILLKLCRAQASMALHEQALDNCEKAYEVLSTPMPGTFVDPHKLRDALEARAEAHMNDKNYDDAVTDLRDALEKASGDKQQGLQTKLNEAENQKRKWRCVDPSDRKTWQDNRCGHPNPQNGRDHNAVLELPANLGELPKDKQCDWIKKQYKKLARKWHPDKYKGKKERAGRKMNECAEAKEILTARAGCSKGK